MGTIGFRQSCVCLAKSPRFCIRQSQVPINLFAVPPNRHLHRPKGKKEKKGGKEKGEKEKVIQLAMGTVSSGRKLCSPLLNMSLESFLKTGSDCSCK